MTHINLSADLVSERVAEVPAHAGYESFSTDLAVLAADADHVRFAPEAELTSGKQKALWFCLVEYTP